MRNLKEETGIKENLTLDDGVLIPCFLYEGKLMQIILTNDQRELLKDLMGCVTGAPIKIAETPICNAEIINEVSK